MGDRLRQGEIIVNGGKMFVMCTECGNIIQTNKWLFGSLHFCSLGSE